MDLGAAARVFRPLRPVCNVALGGPRPPEVLITVTSVRSERVERRELRERREATLCCEVRRPGSTLRIREATVARGAGCAPPGPQSQSKKGP